MHLRPVDEETAMLGNQSRKGTRYLVKLEIGGLTGMIASLLGKKPPDLRYWFVTGDVPAFVKAHDGRVAQDGIRPLIAARYTEIRSARRPTVRVKGLSHLQVPGEVWRP